MYIKIFIAFILSISGLQIASSQPSINSLLSKRHVMRTITHATAHNIELMEYFDRIRKGRRKTDCNLTVLLDQLVSDDIINLSQDTIVIIASCHHYKTSEVVVRCNNGIYCLYKDFCKMNPYVHFDSTEEALNYLRAPFKETDPHYYALEKYMWDKTFLCNTSEIIRIIRYIGNPGEYELWNDIIWQIIIKDGKIIKDEQIIYDPLNYHFFRENIQNTDNKSIDSLILKTFTEPL